MFKANLFLFSILLESILCVTSSSSTTTSTSTYVPLPYFSCCGFENEYYNFQCIDGQFNVEANCEILNGTVVEGDCSVSCPELLLNETFCVSKVSKWRQVDEEDLPVNDEFCGESYYNLIRLENITNQAIKDALHQYIAFEFNVVSNNITDDKIPDDVYAAASFVATTLVNSCPNYEIIDPTWISVEYFKFVDSSKILELFNKGKQAPLYRRDIHKIYYFNKC